jgi:hypothetical protein
MLKAPLPLFKEREMEGEVKKLHKYLQHKSVPPEAGPMKLNSIAKAWSIKITHYA